MELLMRTLLILVNFLVATSAFAASNDLKCIDLRKTLFAPCEEGLNRYFYKGSCTNSSEVEHAYCAKYEMTKIQKVRSEIVVPWEAVDGRVQAFVTSTGNLIVANENAIHNCKDATVLFGQSKEANDNYDPSKGEIGIADELIRFECRD